MCTPPVTLGGWENHENKVYNFHIVFLPDSTGRSHRCYSYVLPRLQQRDLIYGYHPPSVLGCLDQWLHHPWYNEWLIRVRVRVSRSRASYIASTSYTTTIMIKQLLHLVCLQLNYITTFSPGVMMATLIGLAGFHSFTGNTVFPNLSSAIFPCPVATFEYSRNVF